jgi:hypothetical protein
MDELEGMAFEAYDRAIGPDLSEVAVNCCIIKAPCGDEKAGRSPVDRGKRGIKRSVAVDARCIPLGVVSAPQTATTRRCSARPWMLRGLRVCSRRGRASASIVATTPRQPARGCRFANLLAEISEKGKPAPLNATGRWIVERTNFWQNAHKKLVWCTERRARVVDFWMAFSNVVIIVGRLVCEAWKRYRWDGRPLRRP